MGYYIPVVSPIVRRVKRQYYPWRYKGSEVFCPICEGTFKAFRICESGYCPGCNSQARERLLWLYLENKWPRIFTDPITLLYFAPTFCLDRAFRQQPNLKYVSADLYEPEAMIRLDITDISLPDESIEVVLCSHVLEHVPNDRKAMRELFRILRPGGTAFIQVPQDHRMETTSEDPSVIEATARNRAFGQNDHVRRYGRDFTTRLQEAGFDVSVVKYTADLDEASLQRLGLWHDSIYVCQKPDSTSLRRNGH